MTRASNDWQVAAADWLKLLHLQDSGWITMAVAAVCLVVMIWVFVRFVTGATEDVDPAEADREMLDAVNDLRAQGDLSEDEFRNIKGRLVSRLGQTSDFSSKTGTNAKSAGRRSVLKGLHATPNSIEQTKSASSQPDKTSSFDSPTNVPNSPQHTDDLAERGDSTSSESTRDETASDQTPDSKA